MKSLKLFNLIITVSIMLFMLSACETDLPNTCPDLQFTVNVNGDSTDYTITADFEGIEDVIYGWYVNDDLVEMEDQNESRNNTFDFNFASGTYTVCIKAESVECGGSIEFCQEVTIRKHQDKDCPELKFDKDRVSDSKYLFTADFPGIDTIAYTWYVDGDSIETESLDDNRQHAFDFEFEKGEHTICIIALTDHCGALDYCKQIDIEQQHIECPELYFTKEKMSSTKYLFTADFDERDTTAYTWYVDGEAVETVAVDEENTHMFDYVFETGEHVVCIKADIDTCSNLEYCKEIVIEEPVCPELSFTAEAEGPYEYEFEANFENKTHTQYKWHIDGDLVDQENFEGVDTNHELYWQFEPGTYTVCIESVATDECESKEFCKEIIIKQATCADPAFEYEITDDGFKFFADFDGQDTTKYKWYLNNDVVDLENHEDNETDHYYLASLDPGTYTICIVTDQTDYCEAKEYCETITVEQPVNDCITLSYAADQVAGGYKFLADFEGRDEVTYIWKVFINDDLQGSEVRESGSDDDHEFSWQFEPGVVYEVCLKQDGCNETMLCEEFSID